MKLVSPELALVPMHADILRALLAEDRPRAGLELSAQIAPDFETRPGSLRRRLGQLEADPSLLPWLLRAVVERSTGTMCGVVNFHSRPGPDDLREVAADGVELGYAIAPSFRRRGYARQAARMIMRWAYDAHDQRCFVLAIAQCNKPSLALARSMNFWEAGSRMDEEHGPELYFVRRFTSWPDDWSEPPRPDPQSTP